MTALTRLTLDLEVTRHALSRAKAALTVLGELRPSVEHQALQVAQHAVVAALESELAALRYRATHWREWHTDECASHMEDPGASCVCRPPHAAEPLNPTAMELALSVQSK